MKGCHLLPEEWSVAVGGMRFERKAGTSRRELRTTVLRGWPRRWFHSALSSVPAARVGQIPLDEPACDYAG